MTDVECRNCEWSGDPTDLEFEEVEPPTERVGYCPDCGHNKFDRAD